MSLYLCVDCGGSKTSAVICNASGKIIGRGDGGPSNFSNVDFLSSVATAVGIALQTSTTPALPRPPSLPPSVASPFNAAWFGISGVDSQNEIDKATMHISSLIRLPKGPRLIVTNDVNLLASPLRVHPDVTYAVAVIAGTGSNIVALREIDGKIERIGRIGGWGWMLGDEGGGFHVGREAIRQILLEQNVASAACSQAPLNYLTTQVLTKFNIVNIMEILSLIHAPDPSSNSALLPDSPTYLQMPREKRLSSLSPLVFDAAFIHRDPLALKILHTCAIHLASSIALLIESSRKSSVIRGQDSILCFGGSLVKNEAYRKLILDDLVGKGHIFRYVEYITDVAASGAAGLASMVRNNPDAQVP